jgi:hypothetical protein
MSVTAILCVNAHPHRDWLACHVSMTHRDDRTGKADYSEVVWRASVKKRGLAGIQALIYVLTQAATEDEWAMRPLRQPSH